MWQSGSDWQMDWSNNGERMSLHQSGSIEFTADLTDVKSLSDGGYFIFSHRVDGVEHGVEIRSASGKITRAYSVDRRARPWDDEARRWLASELPKLVRRSGLGAEERTRQILASKGADGVLAEIKLLEGDYVRRVYFTHLFKQAKLDAAAMTRALTLAGSDIRSDYELSETLRASAPVAARNQSSAKAYVDALTTVSSDYEHRRALIALLQANGAVDTVHELAIQSAGSMRSDYEKAEALRAALAKGDAGHADALFDAVRTMRSDYEKKRVLTAVAKARPTREVLKATFDAVGLMRSDYERAEVLMTFVDAPRSDAALRQAFVNAAQSIHSQYEQSRVLAALARSESR